MNDYNIVFTLDTGRSVYILRDDSVTAGRDRFSLFRSNCDNPPLAVFGGPREWSIVQSLAVIISDIQAVGRMTRP
jgi:hypothetical protein